MFARIGTWQGSPDELERWISRARDHVKPSLRRDRGLKAAYWLVDRDGGKGLIVTIWQSEQAMRASEEARTRRQAATSTATGATVTTDRYEVVDYLPERRDRPSRPARPGAIEMSPDMRQRVRTAAERLRGYEGRLKDIEARLKMLRTQAQDAGGRARVRFSGAERQIRATMDTTVKRVDEVIKTLQPRLRRAAEQTKNAQRALRAGIKAAAARYRESRRK